MNARRFFRSRLLSVVLCLLGTWTLGSCGDGVGPRPQRTLTVAGAGTGSGTVTSTPSGINCGVTCSASYDSGTVVTLTPTPAAGSVFAGWSGACTGTGTCQVTMSQARNVTATFNLQQFPLTVTKAGTGTGTVTSNPAGIDCGVTCTVLFNSGTVVTLTATPASGSVFAGWSGDCTGSGATCQVTMNQDRNVTASFALALADLVVTVLNSGSNTGVIGDSIPLSTVTVHNQGSASAARFRIGFYWSTDASITPSDAYSGSYCDASSGLDVGAEGSCIQSIRVPRSLPAGTYYLGAIADDLGEVVETNEGNNTRSDGPISCVMNRPPCSSAEYLGSVSGDEGAGLLSRNGWGEAWFRVRITEDNTSSLYLSAAITLFVPSGVDYDLYVYCESCAGSPAGSSTNGTGQTDEVVVRWEDRFVLDDAHDILIQVRYYSGGSANNWTLQILGNQGTNVTTCFF